jgi:multiple sugar transport system substrate-binding protein
VISRRHFLGGGLAATASAFALSSCASTPAPGEHVIRYWGMGAGDKDKDEKVREAFKQTEAGKNAEIYIDQVPSSSNQDMSQIITAVRGGTAPDLWWMDRFNAVQNASLGLLEPIDSLIEKYEDVSPEEFKKQWIQFAVDEMTYEGKMYGLPVPTDGRALLYNENVLKKAKIDLEMVDPDQHTLTWDELREISRKVTKKDKRGNFTHFGFAPWLDQGSAFTWAMGVGAEVYDNDTATLTLDTPDWKKTFEIYEDWAEEFPYSQVDAFFATYEPPNHPPAQTAMFSDRLAFTPTGPWQIQGNKKYAPDLPLKWTWLPVENDGDDHYTWAGGQSLVIPRGANITKTLWEFLKFFASYDAAKLIQPAIGNLPTNLEAIVNKAYDPDAEFFAKMLPASICRPPLPTGTAIWDTLDRTRSSVALGASTPQQAIDTNQDYVKPKQDLYPGYKLPETYGEPSEVPSSWPPS